MKDDNKYSNYFVSIINSYNSANFSYLSEAQPNKNY